ncbi:MULTISPECIES: DUF1700 domain-containing protein [Bacillus]|uniref:DUF1700 domain-containing protein n=1 Tax=Bacillus xiamenensis TaxID=1178537 RepID=A0ABT4F141_9BACI|nr:MULTISPECIES: DUF1700 domain-containing protein [Bacillus]EKF35545.1 hypothetical protein BA1_09756 [Bacillus xiamenensis]MBG9910042.1 membrane protein [Bacillus xiamenensis]MCY9575776.1 DUF1700 domain-containing protein [Bacillus xiamenensis]QGX67237.1 DUF1700 domain-containing protein [Bacillus sp. ms-22]
MNKKEFLSSLEKHLHRLGEKESERFIEYYDEMIEDYQEDGYSEQEAVHQVGQPAIIAEGIMKEQGMKTVEVPTFGEKATRFSILILGFPLWGSILAAVILLILSVYMVIWCIPLVTGALTLSGLLGGCWSIIGTPFIYQDGLHVAVTQFGLGILLLGVGLLCGIATVYLTKLFTHMTVQTSKAFMGMFRKKVVRI